LTENRPADREKGQEVLQSNKKVPHPTMKRTHCIYIALALLTSTLLTPTSRAALPLVDDFNGPAQGQRAEATAVGTGELSSAMGLAGVIGGVRHVYADLTATDGGGSIVVSVNGVGSELLEVASSVGADGVVSVHWNGHQEAYEYSLNLDLSKYTGIRICNAVNYSGVTVYRASLFTESEANRMTASTTRDEGWSGDIVFWFGDFSSTGSPSLTDIDRVEFVVDTAVNGRVAVGSLALVPEVSGLPSALVAASLCLLVVRRGRRAETKAIGS